MADDSAERPIAAAPGQRLWRAGLWSLLFGGLLAAATFVAYRGRAEFGDEGSFCTIGQGILGGRLPYRDLFNEKPPLQYFWTAAVMAFGGPTLAGARMAASIAMTLTTACIVLGPLRRGANRMVVIGVMAATALIAIRLEAYRNTADSTLALLYALSAVILVRDPLKTRSALLLGAAHGLALGFRQTALASALVVLLSPRLTRVRVMFAIGLLGGLLAWLVPLAATGTLPDLVRATVLFHFGNPDAASYLRHNVDHWASVLVWLLLLAAVAAGPKRSLGDRIWAICWLVVAALAYYGRREEFRLWPSAAAALAMLAWDETLLAGLPGARRIRAAAPLALAGLIAGVTALHNLPPRQRPISAVAAEVARIAGPRDEVWAGPFAPYVYCLSERRPASRYYFVVPWTNKAEVRDEIVRDILAKRPIIVIQRSNLAFDIDRLVPELGRILREQYQPVADVAGAKGFTIYRPIPPAAQTAATR